MRVIDNAVRFDLRLSSLRNNQSDVFVSIYNVQCVETGSVLVAPKLGLGSSGLVAP